MPMSSSTASTTRPTTTFVSLLQMPRSTFTQPVNHARRAGESRFSLRIFFPSGQLAVGAKREPQIPRRKISGPVTPRRRPIIARPDQIRPGRTDRLGALCDPIGHDDPVIQLGDLVGRAQFQNGLVVGVMAHTR